LLKYIDLSNITTLASGTSMFEDCDSIEYFGLENVTSSFPSGSFSFGYMSTGVNAVLNLRQVTGTVGASAFRFTTKHRKVFLHEITNFSPAPNNNNSPAHFVISKATTIGASYSSTTNSFLEWNPYGDGKVYVHASMETINSGNPSADMDYLVSRGFTVIYVANYTAPSAISDLSASSITGTTFDLDFTTPSSTNTIQHYDVYIDYDDGRGFVLLYANEISASGGTVTVGSGYSGVDLKVKVRTIDEYYNMSDFSNEITVSI
jgi:hypothetical protein